MEVQRRLEAADPAAYSKWKPVFDGDIARVVRVYDGDSLTVLACVGGVICEYALRIRGIDCPEIKGRGESEKRAAEAVRDVVRTLYLDRICSVVCHGTDKYGRIVADVAVDDRDLCGFLLHHELGRAYDNTTRKPFTSAEIKTIFEKCEALKQ